LDPVTALLQPIRLDAESVDWCCANQGEG